MGELVVDEETHAKSKELLLNDEALSITDASSIVLMDVVNAESIATYDAQSFGRRRGSIVGPGYWESLDATERKTLDAVAGGAQRTAGK